MFQSFALPPQSKLGELEMQVQATRTRTLKLLKEKDTETQKLKDELQQTSSGHSEYPVTTMRQQLSSGNSDDRRSLSIPVSCNLRTALIV